jgi:bifunctional non-homologous end joining protein LigD
MASSTKERAELIIENEKVTITSPSKPLWPDRGIQKLHYLQYLSQIAPHLLPFLEKRLLTVIRYPHGAEGESFYQKNCPDYAPDFVRTHESDGINYIVCSDLPTLIWLGNQLAFEYHIPFHTITSTGPSEIVFDLDPPSRQEFHLAVEAALMIKEVLDKLKLISYVKTSGNKGLQLYIPLPENRYSYEDTRRFTQFIAQFITSKEPNWFTTERMKAKRGNKLYVDYIQHAEGKTIISPYSVRGNKEALVATPLYWKEVTLDLRPEHFPLDQAIERIEKMGCPFASFFDDKKKQSFEPVLEWLDVNSL